MGEEEEEDNEGAERKTSLQYDIVQHLAVAKNDSSLLRCFMSAGLHVCYYPG